MCYAYVPSELRSSVVVRKVYTGSVVLKDGYGSADELAGDGFNDVNNP